MDPVQSGLHLVLSAAFAAASVALVARVSRRRVADGAGLAVAIALVWQFVVQEGWPSLPPTSKWHTIVLAALALAVATTALGIFLRRSPPLEQSIALAAVTAGAIVALAKAPLLGSLQPIHIAAACILPVITLMVARTGGAGGLWLGGGLAACCAALAGLALIGSFAKLGIVVGSTGVAVALVAVVLWWRKLELGGPGLAAILGIMALVAGMGGAYYDGHFPLWLWWLPLFAPLAGLAARLRPIAARPRLAAATLVGAPALVAFLAAAIAGGLAASHAADDEGSGADYSGYGGS